MGPTNLLMQEHELIAKGLAVLREMAERIERGESVPPDSARRLLDFFVAFADQHHHLKEEKLLFPALVEAGLPAEHGPIGVMLREHEIGRALVARLPHRFDAGDRYWDAHSISTAHCADGRCPTGGSASGFERAAVLRAGV